MELTNLKYFAEAARTENMSKAAANLHISQPTLSKAISKLEQELDTTLFERAGRRIIINRKGQELLREIEPIIEKLQGIEDTFASGEIEQDNCLIIGIWGSSDAMSKCIAAFAQKHPNVRFEVRWGIENVQRLDISEFDALLYSSSGEYFKKYRGTTVLREDFMLVVHEQSEISKRISVEVSELSTLPLIIIEKETLSEPEQVCRRLGVKLNAVSRVNDTAGLMSLVRSAVGCAILPESECGLFRADSKVRLLHIRGDELNRELRLAFKREKLLSETGREFMNFCGDFLK